MQNGIKKVSKGHKTCIAKFDYTDEELKIWSEFEVGDRVKIEGTITNVWSFKEILKNGTDSLFVFLVINKIKPVKI